MRIFCIEDFKKEFKKLSSKKSYQSLEKDIINYFFDKNADQLSSGTRLNNSDLTPYIKKRIKGAGGFRFYFLLIYKSSCLYLLFVHPKTGTYGVDNISNDSISYLYKEVLKCIKSGKLYDIQCNEAKTKLTFKKKAKEIK
jgi:hypothetical protein